MPGWSRDTLALALARRFLGAFAPAFVATHATIAALGLAFLRAQLPGQSWSEAVALTADALVVALDVTLTGTITAAACVTAHGAALRGQLLSVALAGRAPWRVFVPTALALAVVAAGAWWWVGHAAPQAMYRLRYPVADAVQALRLLRPGEPTVVGDWTIAVARNEGERVRDVVVARADAATATALVAATASLAVSPLAGGAATVDAEFREGRWLARDRQRIALDLGFERLVASTDARAFSRPDKSALLPLAYYRDDELAGYREQTVARWQVGANVDAAAARRVDAIGLVRGLRVAAAAQPLLAFALVVWLLARARPRGRGVAIAVCVAIGVGLLARIGLEARAGKVADLQSPWLAFVPPLLSITLAAPFARRRGGAL